ncbi:MAG: hypothetical protein JXQ96_00915 [Cyclobacteriaceae bacterium]
MSFNITPDMLEFTGMEMERILEPGSYKVYQGGSSDLALEASFKLL